LIPWLTRWSMMRSVWMRLMPAGMTARLPCERSQA
jgi:hypothetical protein